MTYELLSQVNLSRNHNILEYPFTVTAGESITAEGIADMLKKVTRLKLKVGFPSIPETSVPQVVRVQAIGIGAGLTRGPIVSFEERTAQQFEKHRRAFVDLGDE
mgnify:CR=1 FL=1